MNLSFKIKNFLKFIISKVVRKKFILSRCACLGRDVLSNIENISFDNFQKNRIDNKATKKKLRDLKHLFVDDEILRMVMKQSVNFLDLWCKPSAIVFDTYSELVDRQFHINGTSFYCVASDVKRTSRINVEFGDLIEIDSLHSYYEKQFTRLNDMYKCGIYVIHFSANLDKRSNYKKRASEIFRILKCLEQKLDFLSIINLPENEYQGDGSFPYHFDAETKMSLSKLLINKL